MGKFVRRNRKQEEGSYVRFDQEEEPLNIYKPLFDLLLKDKQYSNLYS